MNYVSFPDGTDDFTCSSIFRDEGSEGPWKNACKVCSHLINYTHNGGLLIGLT